MSVEKRVTWGALYLYAFARSRKAGSSDGPLFGEVFNAEQVESPKLGASLWAKRDVPGGRGELETLLSAIRLTVPEKAPQIQRPRASLKILVRPLPPGIACYRVAVRADSPRRTAADVSCKLVSIEPDVELVLVDHPAGHFRLEVNGPWTEVSFAPESDLVRRTRVELRPAADDGTFRAARIPGVLATIRPRERPPPAKAKAEPSDPAVEFFALLERTRVVTEEEALRLFGSPRALRRFSLEFDDRVAELPFRVRIETTADGKRYIREGDR